MQSFLCMMALGNKTVAHRSTMQMAISVKILKFC